MLLSLHTAAVFPGTGVVRLYVCATVSTLWANVAPVPCSMLESKGHSFRSV